jgi:hypothetical protein
MMKKALLVLVTLLILAVTFPVGYLVWRIDSMPRYDPATLEGIAQEWISDCGPAQPTIAFEVLERRETPQGTLLLVEAACFSVYQIIPIYGYLFGQQIGPGQLEGGGAWGQGLNFSIENLVEYSMGESRGNGVRTTVVYGRTLVAQVALVEATFEGGQVVQDDATDGRFALLDHQGRELLGLRVLDAQGNELATTVRP